MKKIICLVVTVLLMHNAYCQKYNLVGCWAEYKRGLINGEDGSNYTFDGKPFVPEFQFQFFKDSNKVAFCDEYQLYYGFYSLEDDTLTIERPIHSSKGITTSSRKFIIESQKTELIIKEYKRILDENLFIKKFYFQKCDSLKNTKKKIELPVFLKGKPAVFKGGNDSLGFFIKKNIIYPNKLRKAGIEGKVYIKIVINGDGTVNTCEFLACPRLEFAQEAMRLMRIMPQWEPAEINEKDNRTMFNLPIHFSVKK